MIIDFSIILGVGHTDVYKRQVVGTVETRYKTPIKSLITPLIVTVKQFVINSLYNKSNKNCSHAIKCPLILNTIVLQYNV